jgi:predicted lipid-binding transport protein (Tim44 family)
MKKIALSLALATSMGLTACSDPYDPSQRAVGGGLLGAGTGAALGGIAGGGRGAAIGALAGGGIGALGGAATTPNRPYYQQGYQPGYDSGYQQAPAYYPQPRPYGY